MLKRFYSKQHLFTINGKNYLADDHTNVSSSILEKVGRNLHNQKHHPLQILKSLIETHFSTKYPGTFLSKTNMHPVVSVKENFDDLLIPKNHPGRLQTDTYYINQNQVLRTHTSAHQSQVLSSKESMGYLLTADVYRRDSIDASHYPCFHQMEGLLLFNKSELENIQLPESKGVVQDFEYKDSSIVDVHLKRTLENLVLDLFSKYNHNDLKIRWIEAYFPFTHPSYEMEVWFKNEWLELLGCGVIQQKILDNSNNSDKVGWAFGLGLERIAMFLFGIPDIRLFWSKDQRFLNQFKEGTSRTFKEFSKYPVCWKDISFWCPPDWNENDICDVARQFGGDLIESIKLIDQFQKAEKTSRCYRIEYRSMERTLTNDQVDEIHNRIAAELEQKYKVQIR